MRQPLTLCAAAFFALLAFVAGLAEAAGQTPEVTTYKDWAVKCLTPEGGGPKACEMSQSVFADEAKTQRALLVVVGYPEPNGEPAMLLILPLGISLPPGVFLQIDESEPQQVPIERCESTGCRVELLLASSYLEDLNGGTQAVVYAHDRQRRRFTIPFSLLGFSAGLNALTAN